MHHRAARDGIAAGELTVEQRVEVVGPGAAVHVPLAYGELVTQQIRVAAGEIEEPKVVVA